MNQNTMQFTITVPTDGSGKASIVGRKGDVAVFRQFDFADADDLTAQIYSAAEEMVEREIEAPVIPAAAE